MHLGRVGVETPDGREPRIVAAANATPDRWVDVRTSYRLDLERDGATPVAARRLAAAVVPSSMARALESGASFLKIAEQAASEAADDALASPDARFVAPIDPPAFRDFMAFGEHFRASYRRTQTPVPDLLYELPLSYMGSAQGILGPDDSVPWPSYSSHMDFELELGIVIGRGGRNLRPEDALDHVLGITIVNDFSARDIQFREMAGRLGPSKGKHFATAVGPRIVTLDAIDPHNVSMTARVNGETWTSTTSEAILWSVAEIVAWASTGENLVAGTLLGTGTVGGGCGWELDRVLQADDVVELEVPGIGVLRNTVRLDGDSTWWPEERPPAVGTLD